MGLQVRVRHALGERLMDLPDRTVENPVHVGRAGGCEVQVPSVSVAPKHCALFRHEGHWVVQDVGGSTGTYVNGQPVTDPAVLQIGDVISIGSETAAPTIEVDPAAAAEGRHGWAGDEVHVAVAAAVPGGYGHAAVGYAAAGARGGYAGGYAAQGYVTPGASAPGGWAGGGHAGHADHADHADDNGLAAALGASTATATASGQPAARSSYRARQQGSNTTAIVIGVVVAVLIVGGTIWAVAAKMGQPDVKVVTKTAPSAVTSGSAPRSNNMFGIPSDPVPSTGSPRTGGGTSPTPTITPKPSPGASKTTAGDTGGATGTPAATPKVVTPAVTPAATPKPTAKPPEPKTGGSGDEGMDPVPSAGGGTKTGTSGEGMDPVAGSTGGAAGTAAKPPEHKFVVGEDAAWSAIEDLKNTEGNPANDLFKVIDYQRTNPGKHEDEIATIVDKKLDRVWWERIDGLFKKRDRLTADINKKKKELWDETVPEVKKQGLEQVKKWEGDLKKSTEILRDSMAYGADQPPNLDDKSQLAQLGGARDKAKYNAWKKATMNSIQANKGHLPWEGDQ